MYIFSSLQTLYEQDLVFKTSLILHIKLPKYRNDPKFSDAQNICFNHSKVLTMWLYHTLMSPNDADGMANSADPDQTAPL